MLWFVLALGFVEGAVFNFLPVTFSIFERTFHVSLEQLGRSQVVWIAGATLFSIVGGSIIMRIGIRRAAIGILAALLVSLAAIGASPAFGIVLLAACLLGFAVVGMEVVASSMISDSFPEQRQYVFFIWGIVNAAGATVGPAALGLWLSHSAASASGWRLGYFGVAGILTGMVVWAFLLPLSEASTSESPKAERTRSLPIIRRILTNPVIYIVSLATFLHGVGQMGMVSWIGQVYQKRYEIGLGQAAYFISFNSAGFFVGRSVLGWLTRRHKIPELVVLGTCAIGGTLAFVATIAAPSYWVGLLAFTLAGVFISGDAPSIYSYTGFRFAGQTAIAFALMNGLGNTGGAFGPYLIGFLGSRLGLITGIWLMPLFTLALGILAFVWFAIERRRNVTRGVAASLGEQPST